jgi:hypothetical protein
MMLFVVRFLLRRTERQVNFNFLCSHEWKIHIFVNAVFKIR